MSRNFFPVPPRSEPSLSFESPRIEDRESASATIWDPANGRSGFAQIEYTPGTPAEVQPAIEWYKRADSIFSLAQLGMHSVLEKVGIVCHVTRKAGDNDALGLQLTYPSGDAFCKKLFVPAKANRPASTHVGFRPYNSISNLAPRTRLKALKEGVWLVRTGQRALCLRDMLDFAPSLLALPPDVFIDLAGRAERSLNKNREYKDRAWPFDSNDMVYTIEKTLNGTTFARAIKNDSDAINEWMTLFGYPNIDSAKHALEQTRQYIRTLGSVITRSRTK